MDYEDSMGIEERRARHKINKENARNKAREFIATYLLEHPCTDCGEGDPIVLTFDHVRGEKRDNISDMVRNGLSVEAIRTEIEKTEVTCFNCHALREQKRMGAYRWRMGKVLWNAPTFGTIKPVTRTKVIVLERRFGNPTANSVIGIKNLEFYKTYAANVCKSWYANAMPKIQKEQSQ